MAVHVNVCHVAVHVCSIHVYMYRRYGGSNQECHEWGKRLFLIASFEWPQPASFCQECIRTEKWERIVVCNDHAKDVTILIAHGEHILNAFRAFGYVFSLTCEAAGSTSTCAVQLDRHDRNFKMETSRA